MALDLYKYVASVPDYPEKGIIFRDILPLMADGAAFKQATDELVDYAKDKKVDMVVGPEARGFIVGCPIARERVLDLLRHVKRVSCQEKQLVHLMT